MIFIVLIAVVVGAVAGTRGVGGGWTRVRRLGFGGGRIEEGRRFRRYAKRGHAFAALAQQLLHALDGVTFLAQQVADAAQQGHVLGPVIAPPAAALEGLDGGEAG